MEEFSFVFQSISIANDIYELERSKRRNFANEWEKKQQTKGKRKK